MVSISEMMTPSETMSGLSVDSFAALEETKKTWSVRALAI